MLGSDVRSGRGAGRPRGRRRSATRSSTSRSFGAVERVVSAERPEALINCAAWTDVDGAESNLAEATKVNGDGARNLAAATAMIGCKIVFPSTDYVFDGTKDEPYVESDPVNPMSAYGKSKLVGEGETVANNPRHFIVRVVVAVRDKRQATSSTRCSTSVARWTRSWSSRTRSAAPPTRAISPKDCCA